MTPSTPRDRSRPGRAKAFSGARASSPAKGPQAERQAPPPRHVPGALWSSFALDSGHGQPLDRQTRRRFESRFGQDFGDVRIHTGPRAAESARSIDALAYTVGRDIVFGDRQFTPATGRGDRLLAHELTHTVQQRGASTTSLQAFRVTDRGEPGEREADRAADAVMSGRPVPAVTPQQSHDGTARIQRAPADPATTSTSAEDQSAKLDAYIDLSAVTWTPADDYVLHILSEGRLFLVPSTGLLSFPEPVEGKARTGEKLPFYGIPSIGKEGRALVTTQGNAGVWLEAGGRPAALLPGALAALRARMGITVIDGIIGTHLHDDHVRDIPREIAASRVPASGLIIPGAWLQGRTGPLVRLINALRNTTDPGLLALGYGPAWQPAHPIVTPLPATGPIRIPFRIGQAQFELIGRGESFAAYERAHRAGSVAAPLADAASFLTIVRSPGAAYEIADVSDLRGSHILDIRDSFERARPGSFAEIFARVRLLHNFDHHLSKVITARDAQGLIALLEVTQLRTGDLTIVVQTTGQFRSEALITALRDAGVRVITANELVSGDPGNVMAQRTGAISTRGAGIESGRGNPDVYRAHQRLNMMREISAAIGANPDLFRFEGKELTKISLELQTEITRLESLIRLRYQLTVGSTAAGATPAAAATLAANLAELRKVEGIEARLTLQDLEFVRRVTQNAADLRALRKEIQRMRGIGEASVELFQLISRLEPKLAESLMFDSQGRPLPPKMVRRALTAQVRLQQTVTGVHPPTPRGRRIAAGFLGLQIAMEIAPVVTSWKQANYSQNIHQGFQRFEWWRERGAVPTLGAAVDPVFSEAAVLTDQQDIYDRVSRKLWGNAPGDSRMPEEKLPKDVRDAGPIDFLWLEAIDEESWDTFTEWVTSHVRNYDDFQRYFGGWQANDAVRSEGSTFPTLEWSVRLSKFETSGWNRLEDRWEKSDRLTTTMRKTAARVIEGTRQSIQKTWDQRAQPEEGLAFRAPDSAETWQPTLAVEAMRPTGRARFRPKTDREVYSTYTREPIVASKDWPKDHHPIFLVFGNERAPDGYVVVSGGDYTTYAMIRRADTYTRTTLDIVKMYKRADALGAIGLKRFRPDAELTSSERQALHALNNQRGRFTKYPDDPSNPWVGEIEIFSIDFGSNVSAVALARTDDLEFTSD